MVLRSSAHQDVSRLEFIDDELEGAVPGGAAVVTLRTPRVPEGQGP